MEKEEFRVYRDTRIFRKDGKLWNGALWEVSNYGNVRKNGEDYIPYENNGGYLQFGCHNSVHRAVAELFLERIDSKPTVDHIDRDKHNNHSSNLRWATHKEQAANRDNEPIINAVRKANLGNKYLLGHKNVLGRVWVFNPTTQQSNIIDPSELTEYLDKGYIKGRNPALVCRHPHSEESKAKMRAAKLGRILSEETKAKIRATALCYKHTLGKVWVTNPTTAHSTMIAPSELPDYLAKGYIKGRKPKK